MNEGRLHEPILPLPDKCRSLSLKQMLLPTGCFDIGACFRGLTIISDTELEALPSN